MADEKGLLIEDAGIGPAETKFRTILRRKLRERGCAPSQIEAQVERLLHKGVNLSIDVDAILGKR